MTFRSWDGATYDRISAPQARWGAAVVKRLVLAGDERVLDAGCGSGRVTEVLLERLPRGSVVALDASPDMLAAAERRLAGWDNVELVRADLAQPLPLDAPVDAVLSTATFHWVPDHDALFANLAAVLRPGGQLVAQCWGAGNTASVLEAVREVGDNLPGAVTFATPEETARRLEAAGFVEAETWLNAEPTVFDSREAFEEFLAAVCLGARLDRMPPDEHAGFVRAVADRLPACAIDYVRLNITARRAG